MNSPLRHTALLTLSLFALVATCGPNVVKPRAIGEGCDNDAQCESSRCVDGYCSSCRTNDDCTAGNLCGKTPRYLGGVGGPYCVSVDAGCASTPADCPEGFECHTCEPNYLCHDTTGTCYTNYTPPPMCGMSGPTARYDAGWGPGPDTSGKTCYSCIGCPLGSSCVCGASGLVGGLRCDNAGTAIACFITGGVGTCRVYPGDCASNAQCVDAGVDRLCNRDGRCVQCMRDTDCPFSADGGAQGCFNGRCGQCCTSNAICPRSAPQCVQGFCYSCDAFDGGGCTPDAGQGDAGSDGGTGDGGSSDGGSSDGGSSDAGDGG